MYVYELTPHHQKVFLGEYISHYLSIYPIADARGRNYLNWLEEFKNRYDGIINVEVNDLSISKIYFESEEDMMLFLLINNT